MCYTGHVTNLVVHANIACTKLAMIYQNSLHRLSHSYCGINCALGKYALRSISPRITSHASYPIYAPFLYIFALHWSCH